MTTNNESKLSLELAWAKVLLKSCLDVLETHNDPIVKRLRNDVSDFLKDDYNLLKNKKKINISEGNVKNNNINVAQRNSQDNELIKKIFPHKEIIEGESVLVSPYIEEAYPLKDVPQVVVSKMEKTTLTEQWKKGELEAGWYYVLLFSNEEYITFIDGNWVVDDRLVGADIKEVLAEVPDYIEWKNYVTGFCDEHEYNLKLSEENDKLKELLSKAKGMLSVYRISKNQSTYSDKEVLNLLTQIDEVLEKIEH